MSGVRVVGDYELSAEVVERSRYEWSDDQPLGMVRRPVVVVTFRRVGSPPVWHTVTLEQATVPDDAMLVELCRRHEADDAR